MDGRNKKYISVATLLLCLLIAAAMVFVSAAAVPEESVATDTDATATDAAEPKTPACAETGEHVLTKYSYAGDGTHTAVCELCGETFVSVCDYSEAPVWTASGEGTHATACVLCGGPKTEPCIYTETVVPPTQTEKGFTLHLCDICGYEYTDKELPPEQERQESRLQGDTDGDNAVKSNDARAILRAAVRLERLPADVLPYADLDADGKVTSADARAALRVSVNLDPLADRHAYTVAVVEAPTCTAEGKLTFSCDYCGIQGEMVSPANGHRYGEPAVKDATCTEKGVRTYSCLDCDYRYDAAIPEKGHSFSAPVVTDATCTKDGVSVITCTVCGLKESTPIPATGHDWQDTADKNSISCSACGAPASGWIDLGKNTYHCVKGVKDYSWCVIDGARYFFDRNTGILAKNVKVDGIKLGADGKAPTDSYTVEKIRTFINAKKIVAQITDPSDSVSVKKKKAFDWVMGYNYVQYRLVGASMSTPGFEMLFANDIFEKNRTGCCGSTSYAFAFLAVECGCKQVYVCDDGVSTSGHAWVTMEGNNNVYDVVFAKAKGYNINYNYKTSDYRNWPPRKTYVGG